MVAMTVVTVLTGLVIAEVVPLVLNVLSVLVLEIASLGVSALEECVFARVAGQVLGALCVLVQVTAKEMGTV